MDTDVNLFSRLSSNMSSRAAVLRGVTLWALGWGWMGTAVAWGQAAADPAAATSSDRAAAEAFFESKIRPILIDRCLECHGAEKAKAGLRLDSGTQALAGGDSGAAIVPGKPEESLLIQVVRYTGDLKMPPRSKLPDAEIALLADWVKQGALWPQAKTEAGPSGAARSAGTITDEDRRFWAFQIPQPAPLPTNRNSTWARDPIDRFVLAGLEHADLAPAPQADRRTLIRRATLDLHGVPPTPQEIDDFLHDESPLALERVVDRLLASPRYGERYGRHWLDVVRYADSNGLDENLAYANAFRYRDYVIQALNADKPFDQFLHEQLAGDLLPPTGRVEDQLERTVATGFLSLGAKMLAEDDPVKMQMDIIDEQVDTLCRAVLGLTMGCARCHDHKFDPLTQDDYYSLAGIFKSTKTMENFSVVARWQELPLAAPEVVAARAAQQLRIDQVKGSIAQAVQAESSAVVGRARRMVGDLLLAAEAQGRLDALLARVQSVGPPVGQPAPEGALLVEAEDFARGNVNKDRTSYGQGIGVLVNAGQTPNFVEYDLQIPKTGVYQIELRYAAAAARPNRLSIGPQVLRSDAAGKVTGSWNPDTQTWFVEAVVALEAGPVVLRIENPGPFPHIDKLLLAPVRDDQTRPAEFQTAWKEAANLRQRPLVAGFLKSVMQSLAAPKSEPDSIWNTWHEFATRERGESPPAPRTEGLGGKIRERLLAAPAPTSLAELAARYQQLGIEATARWEELQSREATRSLTNLSDDVLEAFRQTLFAAEGPLKPPAQVEELFAEPIRQELAAQRKEQKSLEESLPKFPEAMGVTDGNPENLRVHLRGSHLNLGAETTRRFPQVFPNSAERGVNASQSGRLELAQWLTDRQNPLTARVIVNRVWQWHFGEALVRSPDNFGRLGERPTHPELLDYLAVRLQEQGWSLKALHRQILLSSTWQMSTRFHPDSSEKDPENRLWWRFNRRRLEAEALRDSILAVAGRLDSNMGGTLLPTPNRAYVTSTANINPVVYDPPRRSLYLPVVRSALYDVFQAFDFADPSVQSGRRDTTTVAPQALFLMNSDLVLKQTRELARQLLAQSERTDADRVVELYQRALGRPPRTLEIERGLGFVQRYIEAANTPAAAEAGTGAVASSPPTERAWQALCRAVLASNEFIYVE
jgi:cytochrome c553